MKDEGDAGNSSKSSGKIREENRDSDSQKPSSVKQKTRERLREGTTANPSENNPVCRLVFSDRSWPVFTPLVCCTDHVLYQGSATFNVKRAILAPFPPNKIHVEPQNI